MLIEDRLTATEQDSSTKNNIIAELEKELGEKERAFKAARLAEDKAQERVKSLEH